MSDERSMPQLSAAGEQTMQDVARRHGFSPAAVTSMFRSILRGHGRMAQFGHAEFGGSGQWMRGGMTMISDMFNSQLQARVERLCDELSQLAADGVNGAGGVYGRAAVESETSRVPGADGARVAESLFEREERHDARETWWPDLGQPAATGGQDGVRYAYFPTARRLAIDAGGHVKIYDTLDHRISGVSQQQSASTSLTFSSDRGTVDVAALPLVSGEPESSPPANVVAIIEQLANFRAKGILSEAEFAAKKADLLSRL